MNAPAKLTFAIGLSLLLFGCAVVPRLESSPGHYVIEHQHIKSANRHLRVTYVRPSAPRRVRYCLVFVTGDGGWSGISAAMLRHLADEGYAIAGFSGREIVAPVRRSGRRIARAVAAERLAAVFAKARRGLGLAETTPMIVIGFSRGATIVAFAALHPALRDDIAGAVAISLTREADYLRAAEAEERPLEIELDSKGRIQIYPALKLLAPARVAVIESTNDRYVPAAEARELLGPDTATRRLFTVEAKNHVFRGGRAELLRDLDEALEWIGSAPPRKREPALDVDTPGLHETAKPNRKNLRAPRGRTVR